MVEPSHGRLRVGRMPRVAYVVELLRRTYRAWRGDRVMRLGAGLAYYALFALVPLLAMLIGLASLAYSQADVQAAVSTALADALNLEREAVTETLGDALRATSPSGLGLIGFGSLLLAASLLFVALQDALDVIWHAPVLTGFEHTVRRRATAFVVILLMAILLITLIALQAMIGLLDTLLPTDQILVSALIQTLASLLSWLLVAATVTLVLRILPRTVVAWPAAIVGGVVTTVALAVGSSLFGLYLRTVGVRSAQGVAAGVLVLLLWFYTMSQVVLAGAVLTRQIDECSALRT